MFVYTIFFKLRRNVKIMKKLFLKCSIPLLLLTGLFCPKPFEASAATGSVSIDETNFPDQIFREYVQSEFDDGDCELSESELKNVTCIDVNGKGITSLKGIEYFSALSYLNCSENGLSSLDLSQNTKLKRLNCEFNQLTSLDLTKIRLNYLRCGYNKLTSLDLAGHNFPYTGASVIGMYELNIYAPDYKFDLSTLPGDFDVNRVTTWSKFYEEAYSNVTVDGTILTIDPSRCCVTYDYNTGNNSVNADGKVQFRLCVDNDNPDLVITKQPTDIVAEYDEWVEVPVKAIGKNPTYQWYLKKPGEVSFSKSKITSDTYYAKISEKSCGSQIYCVITDDNGKTVTTKTVTLKSKVAITQQPTDTLVDIGSDASTTVYATGNGLKYQWYVKNPKSTKFTLSSITTETYSYKMTESKSGRQVYCEITDKYGNTVTTDTVTLGGPVKITEQPTDASATIGSTVKTSVKATGVGLKYQWYVKNPTSTKFTKSSITTETYSYQMTESKSERQVYCVITDKDGNKVKTNTVTLTSTIAIIKHPTDVVAEFSTQVKTTVEATGVELKYQWYVLDTNSDKWKTSSITTNEYSFEFKSSKYGRKVYCVITDKYGHTKKTEPVTFVTPGFRVYYSETCVNEEKKFYFDPSGALDLSANIFPPFTAGEGDDCPIYHCFNEDGKAVLKLRIRTAADWKVSSSASYLNIEDINGNSINTGTKGESWIFVYLDEFLSRSKSSTREDTITIESGGKKETYTLVQKNYTVNNKKKSEYIDSLSDTVINKLNTLPGGSETYGLNAAKALETIRCERVTDGIMECYRIDGCTYLAISSYMTSSDNIKLDYILYDAYSTGVLGLPQKDDIVKEINTTLVSLVEVKFVDGIKIVPNNEPIITTNIGINGEFTEVTDEQHDAYINKVKLIKDAVGGALQFLSYRGPSNPIASFTFDVITELATDSLADLAMDAAYDCGNDSTLTSTTYTIAEECVLSKKGEKIEIRCTPGNLEDVEKIHIPVVRISFDLVDSDNNKTLFEYESPVDLKQLKKNAEANLNSASTIS